MSNMVFLCYRYRSLMFLNRVNDTLWISLLNKQRLIVQLLIVRLILKHDTSYDIFFA